MQMDKSQNPVELTPAMVRYSDLAKRIAKRTLQIDIEVVFGEWEGTFLVAYLEKELCLNVRIIGKSFFESITSDLIRQTVHALAYECENTFQSHDHMCAQIGAELTIIALKEPEFFNMEVK